MTTVKKAQCYLHIRSTICDNEIYEGIQHQLPLEKDNGLWMKTFIEESIINNCTRANIQLDFPRYVFNEHPKLNIYFRGPTHVYTDVFFDKATETYIPYFLHFCTEPVYDKCRCKYTFFMAQNENADPVDYKDPPIYIKTNKNNKKARKRFNFREIKSYIN